MFCPSCHAQVSDSMTVCPECGAVLATGMAPTVQAQRTPVRAPQAGPRPDRAVRPASDRSLFLDFNEKPGNILLVMDEARLRQGDFVKSFSTRLRVLLLLVAAGWLLLLLDLTSGYGTITFTLVACVLWAASLLSWLLLRRQSQSARAGELRSPKRGFRLNFALIWFLFIAAFVAYPLALGILSFLSENLLLAVALALGLATSICLLWLWAHRPKGEAFGARFDLAYTIFQTLKDDLAPKRTLIGWLDLSGPQQPGKVARERTSLSGMPIKYYRDEWLRMKMPLCDGTLLRVSLIMRVKARQGRWKKGSSGKTKWKSGGAPQSAHVLRLAVAADQRAYQIVPSAPTRVGNFPVQISQNVEGRLELRTSTDATIDAWDILKVLRFAHDHVKPRTAGASAAMPAGEPSVAPVAGGAPLPASQPSAQPSKGGKA